MVVYGSRDLGPPLRRRWVVPRPSTGRDTALSSMRLPAKLAVLTVFLATTFNLGLCFVNTKLFTTDAQTASLSEVLIVSLAVALLVYRRDYPIVLIIAVVCSYFSLLFLVRGEIDPKPVRDLLLPIVFVHLGQRYLERAQADALVRWLTLIALAVAIFEFVLPTLYTSYFDVLSYYINKGSTRAEAADFIMNGFNINGDRPTGQGRELLPFLGLHRSGSIFLEPVTAANFGAICGAWFLQSDRSALKRWLWVGVCAAIIVLADGRFGLMLLIVAIVLRYVSFAQRPLVLFFLPVSIVGFLMAYATFVATGSVGGNSAGGRLLYAGRVLDSLGAQDWLGMRLQSIIYFDSGYAYSVTQIGLAALAAGWFAFAHSLEAKAKHRYLGSFCMVYVALSLIVSNSMWSIKAGALLWFIVGQTLRARVGTAHAAVPAGERPATGVVRVEREAQ
jgi:putative polymerase